MLCQKIIGWIMTDCLYKERINWEIKGYVLFIG